MIPVYFAMPVTHYHTAELKSDLEYLDSMEYAPYVPSSDEDEAGYKAYGMKYFTDLLNSGRFKGLVFRSFADGAIGQGVATEIISILNQALPVLELRDLDPFDCFSKYRLNAVSRDEVTRRELNVSDTRSRIKLLKEHSNLLDGLGHVKDEHLGI